MNIPSVKSQQLDLTKIRFANCIASLLSTHRHGQDQQELYKIVTEKLSTFILSLMSEYFKLTEARIELEVVG